VAVELSPGSRKDRNGDGDRANHREKLSRQVKLKLRNLYLRFPKNVACNICSWSGGIVPATLHAMPSAGNVDRRSGTGCLVDALAIPSGLTLKSLPMASAFSILAGGLTTPLFKPRASTYKTADFMRDDVDAQLDLTNMPSQRMRQSIC